MLNRLFAITLVFAAAPVIAAEYAKLNAVPFDRVEINDSFWSPRIELNQRVTIDRVFDWCERTGRIDNFAKAAGLMDGEFEGIYFNDSDVHKAIEAAAHALALEPDPELEARVDGYIKLIAAAQEDDGYLNTYYTLVEPDNKWSDLKIKHELYCAGHLIEAGVAWFKATGKRDLLDVGIRFADLIDSIFGPDKRRDVPGHEEIELALVKLYRLTGEERYLKLSQFFIDERGHTDGRVPQEHYAQDHVPVREQSSVTGHAVRAMYLFSGVADMAGITGDQGYFGALGRIWGDLTRHKMYITGGIGVTGHGEGFASGYELPNENAYAETCAAIALAMYNHRLTMLHADARYARVFEQSLYNGLLSGVSQDGTLFFYRNPLSTHGPEGFNPSGGRVGESDRHRQPWFGCACCPPNIARFIPQLGESIYAASERGIYISHYIGSHTQVEIDGQPVSLEIETKFPWGEEAFIHVSPESPAQFELALRAPYWTSAFSLRINGRAVDAPIRDGYALIERRWSKGDTVQVRFPMPVLRIEAHPNVEENKGRLAIQRGPMVYCLEEVDHSVGVHHLAVERDQALTAVFKPELLGGVMAIEGKAQYRERGNWQNRLYRPADEFRETDILAVPYFAWDNRTPGAMTVWLPEHPSLAPAVTLASRSRLSASHVNSDPLSALNDQIEPDASNDESIPRFTWWNHKGTREWVQYEFDEPRIVDAADVYWFDDEGEGECRVPEWWRLLYRDGGEWHAVPFVDEYPVHKDGFIPVSFGPVQTDALRLEARLQDGCSGGLLEWRVWERGPR